MDKFDHFIERGAGEKDFVHAFAFHDCGIVVSNSASPAAKNFDVARAFFSQKIENFPKELDVPTVVT